MQQPTWPLCSALLIQCIRHGKRIGVDLQHRLERWTILVQRLDTLLVHLHQLARGERARRHGVLQLIDTFFF